MPLHHEISTRIGKGQLFVELTDDIFRATSAVIAMNIAFRKAGQIELLNLHQLILSELAHHGSFEHNGVVIRILSEEEYEKWQRAF